MSGTSDDKSLKKDICDFLKTYGSILLGVPSSFKAVSDLLAGNVGGLLITATILALLAVLWCLYIFFANKTVPNLIKISSRTPVPTITVRRYSNNERYIPIPFAVLFTLSVVSAYIYFYETTAFKTGEFGILICQIGGDNAQTAAIRLRNAINDELAKEPGLNIRVHMIQKQIDESSGNPEAHDKARAVGKFYKAQLVIWGNASDGKRFDPRITVVSKLNEAGLASQFSLISQDISGTCLPTGIVEEPITLAHFAIAYSFFVQKRYHEAIKYLDAGTNYQTNYTTIEPDFLYYKGLCYFGLAQSGDDFTNNMTQAFDSIQDATQLYQTNNLFSYSTQSALSLATVCLFLPTGDHTNNILYAIDVYETFLSSLNTTDQKTSISRLFIAEVQYNLILAYTMVKEFDKAIIIANQAIFVLTEKDHPHEWSLLQMTLCQAYSENKKTIQLSIEAGESALQVLKEDDRTSNNWLTVEFLLCHDYQTSSNGIHLDNLKKSVVCGESVLRHLSEISDTVRRAVVNVCLCSDYLELGTNGEPEYYPKAILACNTALGFYTETNDPPTWATLEFSIGDAYAKETTENSTNNLENALDAYKTSLRFYTESNYPSAWAKIQWDIGNIYVSEPGEEASQKAINAFELAEHAYNETSDSENCALIRSTLCEVYTKSVEPLLLHPTAGNILDIENRIETGIADGEASLPFLSENTNKKSWLAVQNDLALLYLTPSNQQNLLHAKHFCETIIKSHSEIEFPEIVKSASNVLEKINEYLSKKSPAD